MRPLTRMALLLLLLLVAGCTPYRVRHDLSYGPDERQTYDVYEPTEDAGAPRPALLVIHGGGWISGDKSWAQKVAERFCPWGYVIVAINYRLAPAAVWPAQLEDAKAALAHMRADAAKLNIREPIAGFGVSAGAHIVAALHLQGDLPHAIGAAGPWDLVNASCAQLDGAVCQLLGVPSAADIRPEARAAVSPATWVRPEADMLLVHAKGDPLTVYDGAVRFEAALRAVGAKVELIAVDSDSHGSSWKQETEAMRRWLRYRQR